MVLNTKETFLVATTGCMNTEPDSMESIIAGSEAGATGCLIALDMTEDGIAVMCSNGGFTLPDGSMVMLAETSFEEVRKVHQKIVSIGQAIELAKSMSCKLGIDLKSTALCAQTRLALIHADFLDETYFVGVSLSEARRLAKAQPQLHIMADAQEPISDESALVRAAQDAGLFGLRVSPAALTSGFVHEAHHVGLMVATTETQDEKELQRLIDLQVNFIETSQPDIAYSLLPKPEEEEEPDGEPSV